MISNKRGFAAMTVERRSQVSAKGGKKTQAQNASDRQYYEHWERDANFIYIEVPRQAVKVLVPMGWEEVGLKDERVPAFLRKSKIELFQKYEQKAGKKSMFPPRRTNDGA